MNIDISFFSIALVAIVGILAFLFFLKSIRDKVLKHNKQVNNQFNKENSIIGTITKVEIGFTVLNNPVTLLTIEPTETNKSLCYFGLNGHQSNFSKGQQVEIWFEENSFANKQEETFVEDPSGRVTITKTRIHFLEIKAFKIMN